MPKEQSTSRGHNLQGNAVIKVSEKIFKCNNKYKINKQTIKDRNERFADRKKNERKTNTKERHADRETER